MKNLISIVSLMALLVNADRVSAQDQNLRKEIEAAEQKWVETWNKRNAEELAKLYLTDAQALYPDEPIMKGREAIRKRHEESFKNLPNREQKVTTLDVIGQGDFATETGTWIEKSEDNSTTEEGTYVMVWKKEGSEWKIFRETWNTTRKEHKLSESLKPLAKLLGSWIAEPKADGAEVRVSVIWKAAVEGSAVAYEGTVRVNGAVTDSWAGYIYPDASTKKLVDVGVSKNGGHGSSAIFVFDDKVIFQNSGVDQDGNTEIGVDEIVVQGETLNYSQLTRFKDGSPNSELLKDIEFKRQ